jgi:hypothetical protein
VADAFHPRLNHVAITLEPAVLDDTGRNDILAFYGEVFGWTEGDNTMEDGDPLILYTGAFGQFIYLLPGEPAIVAPQMDHFGLEVATRDELVAITERAKIRAAEDSRVRVVDVHARTFPVAGTSYTLTSSYIGFLLPLMIELQHIEPSSDRSGAPR